MTFSFFTFYELCEVETGIKPVSISFEWGLLVDLGGSFEFTCRNVNFHFYCERGCRKVSYVFYRGIYIFDNLVQVKKMLRYMFYN